MKDVLAARQNVTCVNPDVYKYLVQGQQKQVTVKSSADSPILISPNDPCSVGGEVREREGEKEERESERRISHITQT